MLSCYIAKVASPERLTWLGPKKNIFRLSTLLKMESMERFPYKDALSFNVYIDMISSVLLNICSNFLG